MRDAGRAKKGAARAHRLLLLAVLAGDVAGVVPAARAQTVVINTNDSGLGSLRAALAGAAPNQPITFSLPLASTALIQVLPASGPLQLSFDGVSVDGTGATDLQIQGSADDVTHLRLLGGDVTFVDIDQSRGQIEVDGVLTYETRTPTTLDVAILDAASGNGALVKTGTSTLVLTRTNAYSDGTTIREGALQAPAAALPGDVLNGGRLVFDQPDDPVAALYSGVIGDLAVDAPGIVEKQGEGTLRLDGGLQGWTGGTLVRAGTLVLAPDTFLAPGGRIQLVGGTLRRELAPASTTTWDGLLTGSGTLQVDGNATLVLQNGSLFGAIDYDDALGSTTVVDEANVARGAIQFNDTGGIYRLTAPGLLGAISGTGTVVLDPGPGNTVVMTADNSHTATQILSGKLSASAGSLSGAVTNDAMLDVFEGASRSITATIDGAGLFTKIGSGTVTVAADQPYTGDTVVSEGTLALEADLTGTSSLAIGPAGVLGGFGDAPLAALDVAGTVAPAVVGADPIRVQSVSLQPGARLQMGVRDDGTSARLVSISGDIDASGSTLTVVPEDGDYSTPVAATLLIAEGGAITGLPTLDGGGLAFLTVTSPTVVGQTSYQVEVQSDVASLASFAQTPNQLAIADDLLAQFDANAASPSPDPQLGALFGAFQVLRDDQVVAALNAFSGEVYTAFASAHLATADRFARTLHRRSRGLAWASGDALLVAGAGLPRAPATSRAGRWQDDSASALPQRPFARGGDTSVWLDGWGRLDSLDGGDDTSDVDAVLAGATLGVDRRLGEGFLLGLAAGYTYADIDVSHLDDDATADGFQGALYAGWSERWGYLNAAGRVSWARNRSERAIDVGTLSLDADADFETLGFGAGGEGGVNLLQLGPASFTPFASFDWTQLDSDDVDEGGAGSLGLHVDSQTVTSLRSEVGLRIGARFDLDVGRQGLTVLPELRGSWRHEFGDTEREVETRLEGSLTGTSLRIVGAEEPRDAGVLGLGWTARLTEQVEASAEYDAIVDGDGVDHGLALTARFRF